MDSIEVMDLPMDNIPGIIDMNDIGGGMGDYGMGDMMGGGQSQQGGNSRSMWMDGPRNVEVGVKMASDYDKISFDLPMAGDGPNINITRDNGGGMDIPFMSDNGSGNNNIFANAQTSSANNGMNFTPASMQKVVNEEERKKKRDLLTKLNRRTEEGYELSHRFTMDNTVEEMEEEYDRLTDAKSFTNSIEWQRSALVTLVSGLEMMNETYDPFDLKLKGYSDAVHSKVESYDPIFEELYDKYKGKGGVPPEMRLVWKLVSTGVMIHATNKIMGKRQDNIEESLRRDPVFMDRVAQAVQSNIGRGVGSFMRDANEDNGGGSYPSSFSGPPQQQQQQQSVPVARREMRGPPNVDDILQQFERHGDPYRQPAASSAAEIQSLASEEIHSQAETMKTAGGTRKKKKSTTPVGSVYSLNV
jgi:hypothetical protein